VKNGPWKNFDQAMERYQKATEKNLRGLWIAFWILLTGGLLQAIALIVYLLNR
jgi:hypothetical protein